MADDRDRGVIADIEARERRNRVPFVIGAILAAILVVILARSCAEEDTDRARIVNEETAAATAAPAASATPATYVPGGLAAYMAGNEPLPYTYELAQVTFASGSAELADSADDEIADVAAALRARSTGHVRLRGYADPEGDVEANQRLSQERAEAVRAALIDAGAAEGQVEIAALGETGDATARQNRRVELELTAR